MFRLTIDTANAAFEDHHRGPELVRILRALADRLEANPGLAAGADGPVADTNGNTVGRYTIEPHPFPEEDR